MAHGETVRTDGARTLISRRTGMLLISDDRNSRGRTWRGSRRGAALDRTDVGCQQGRSRRRGRHGVVEQLAFPPVRPPRAAHRVGHSPVFPANLPASSALWAGVCLAHKTVGKKIVA